MNIQEFRTKFPQYDGMPDEALAKSVQEKFYPTMKYEDFAKDFIGSPKPKEKGVTSQFERIGEIYKQEVSEGGSAFNKMVDEPSGKTIIPGLVGGARWAMAPLTAIGKGAVKEPISEGLQGLQATDWI